jgi:hypothetical protein
MLKSPGIVVLPRLTSQQANSINLSPNSADRNSNCRSPDETLITPRDNDEVVASDTVNDTEVSIPFNP